ncbi:hypothetical protein LOK74_10120 [Brevibacillus humidisoli]|uniref:hypothetical protein n=1 Tax=Brevibacillus humidisoli TaxID=2895522 RepID=UPI001E598111|nr:hypothetical protein [Brevibacillus humidisoli]UFJ42817.1 hypothetical protein LOK74_10120 [Brevibacillus humidisoli]
MAIFWRDLLLGLLAWASGKVAVQVATSWPEPVEEIGSSWPQLQMDQLSDWVTLAIFRPATLVLVGLCLSLSLWLAFHIAGIHARHLLRRRAIPDRHYLLHVILLLYALVLLVILSSKVPLGVGLGLLIWGATASSKWLRQRTLRRKILREYRRGH